MSPSKKHSKRFEQSIHITLQLSDSPHTLTQLLGELLHRIDYQQLAQLLDELLTVVLRFAGYGQSNDELRKLIAPAQTAAQPTIAPRFALTRSELKVVELAVNHLTNKEIASRLVISENTVKTHLQNVYKKLGIRNRGQLLEWWMQQPRDHAR